MTIRHHIVILCAIFALGGMFAPSPSAAQAPGIGDAAPNATLRTAARIAPPAAPPATPPATPAPTTRPPPSPPEQHIVELVNAERTARGLRPVAAQAQLAEAADIHALDQRNRSCRNLSHTGTDGSDVADRVDRTGYRWSRLAENIACGYPDATSVMNGWMNSDGHRRNILHPDLTHIGVSLEQSDGGDAYWVQVFGRQR